MIDCRCYYCGLEGERVLFVRSQGDGEVHWMQLCCPQCCCTPAKIGIIGEKAPWPMPTAIVEETYHGIYVRIDLAGGGSFSGPMVPEHPWRKSHPDAVAREKVIMAEHKARAEAFHKELESEETRLIPRYDRATDAQQAEYALTADKLRRKYKVNKECGAHYVVLGVVTATNRRYS